MAQAKRRGKKGKRRRKKRLCSQHEKSGEKSLSSYGKKKRGRGRKGDSIIIIFYEKNGTGRPRPPFPWKKKKRKKTNTRCIEAEQHREKKKRLRARLWRINSGAERKETHRLPTSGRGRGLLLLLPKRDHSPTPVQAPMYLISNRRGSWRQSLSFVSAGQR